MIVITAQVKNFNLTTHIDNLPNTWHTTSTCPHSHMSVIQTQRKQYKINSCNNKTHMVALGNQLSNTHSKNQIIPSKQKPTNELKFSDLNKTLVTQILVTL